jgi:hypothetical protein
MYRDVHCAVGVVFTLRCEATQSKQVSAMMESIRNGKMHYCIVQRAFFSLRCEKKTREAFSLYESIPSSPDTFLLYVATQRKVKNTLCTMQFTASL